MGNLPVFALLIISLSCRVTALPVYQDHITDTVTINSQTRQAYIVARRNPDLAIRDARRALSSSRAIEYDLISTG